ncbi:MAG TPA: outer membrane beta-barrel protein [Xanthobacteraceae bacterium]|jgi:outer membrane immunogenic protein|nr:outer membrane beta-barrel protein [Xanthobacteraceae bacterium]
MKNVLLTGTALLLVASGSAMAADLSRPPPAPAPVYKAPPLVPAFSWTGCYIGGNGGGLFANKDWKDTVTGAAESSVNINSWLAGAQVGCNYQIGAAVLGIQGDYDWSNGSASASDSFNTGFTDQTTIKALASVTGRVGYAWDRFLPYVKAGGAWVNDDYSATNAAGLTNSAGETRTGWTVGAGGEYAFTNWLTGFVEYNFYDFGTNTNTLTGSLPSFQSDIKQTVSVAKAGLNFKFGGW